MWKLTKGVQFILVCLWDSTKCSGAAAGKNGLHPVLSIEIMWLIDSMIKIKPAFISFKPVWT